MGISIPHGEMTICLYGIQRERVLRITSSFPEGGTMWTKGGWTTKLYSEEQPKPTASQANYKPTAGRAMLINGRTAVPTVTGFLLVSAGNPDLVSLCNGKFLQWPNIERHRSTEQIQRKVQRVSTTQTRDVRENGLASLRRVRQTGPARKTSKSTRKTEVTERRTCFGWKHWNGVHQGDGFDGQNGLLERKVNPGSSTGRHRP